MDSSGKNFEKIKRLQTQVGGVFAGADSTIHNLFIGFLSGLHVLIEDIPGVGKTTLARALAKSAGLDFGRIQFTPDLLPGDILGMTVWSSEKREFVFKEGVIMHQFILADEINRASARTQSSMLEAMQEGSVTIDGKTYILPQPFTVIATQNPASFSGTFPLPEAQLDRFGISLSIGYPDPDNEVLILDRFVKDDPMENLRPIIKPDDIMKIRADIRKIYVDKKIKDYIIRLAISSRKTGKLRLGMSPRASQHLLTASQSEAYLNQRDYVIPEDVIYCAPFVLSHRVILSASAKMERLSSTMIVNELLKEIPIPAGVK